MFDIIGYYQPLPLELEAALEEMRFWDPILGEHAKLIRNGFDITEERLFRLSDRFGMDFDELNSRLAQPIGNPREVIAYIERSDCLASQFRDFNARLAEDIQACRIMTNRPAALLEHMRQEADYFLGKLRCIQGRPTPPRSIFDLPDGNENCLCVPYLLIPRFQDQLVAIAQEENLFWLKDHADHAEVLSLYCRPQQKELIRELLDWHNRLLSLAERAKRPFKNEGAMKRFNKDVLRLVKEWQEYLLHLYQKVLSCSIPTGQVNFPASIANHMAREAAYHIRMLETIDQYL